MVAEPSGFQVQDGQPATGKTQHEVWNAGQDNASLWVRQAEGGVVRRRQGSGVTPPACYPGREMASFLI